MYIECVTSVKAENGYNQHFYKPFNKVLLKNTLWTFFNHCQK